MKSTNKQECERCGELADCQLVLKREEMLSDERGTVWGHVEVPLCDKCLEETEDREPDWDAIRDEREGF
jgi:hypothetical protein